MTRAAVERSAAADATDGQDRADAHHRIGRRQQHDVGVFDRLGDAGSGGGRPRRRRTRNCGSAPWRDSRTHHSWKWIARFSPSSGSVMTTWVSLRSSLAGSSRAPGVPSVAQRLGHLRQRVARAQHLAAHEMGGQVAVAEAEPVGLHAVGGEFLLGVPGFVAMAPAALRVDAAAQGVHAGVEIRADPHPVHPRVVADVDDRGQFVIRLG